MMNWSIIKILIRVEFLCSLCIASRLDSRHEEEDSNSNSKADWPTDQHRIIIKKIENFQKVIPSYLQIIYERLLLSDQHLSLQEEIFQNRRHHRYQLQGQQREKSHRALLTTFLPSEIIHEDFGLNSVIFNISSRNIGIFYSAQIIFTLNPDALIHDTSHLVVHIKIQNQQEKQSQRIWKNTKYYAFDVSSLLSGTMNNQGDQIPNRESGDSVLKLEAIVSQNNRRKQIPLELIFDVANLDGPFLLIQFIPLPISIELLNRDTPSSGRQKRLVDENVIGVTTEEDNDETTSESLRPEDEEPIRKKRLSYTGLWSGSNKLDQPTSYAPPRPLTCRKHEWKVRAADIGLDDIIAPIFIDLGFCAGDCPFPLGSDTFNFTLHSYFVERHRIIRGRIYSPHNLPNSSCVAVSYKSLMVVEASSSGVHTITEHKDALVQSCGCRY